MRPSIARVAFLLATASTSLGCTISTVDKPVTVSTKPLPEASKPEVVKAAKEVMGESCNRVVLLLIPVGIATAESAYADALAKAPGSDVLLNYEARTSMFFAAPFYYEVCAQVHGLAVSSKALISNADDKPATQVELDRWKQKWEREKADLVARAPSR